MIFSSPIFLFLFFPVCLALYYLPFVKNVKYKNVILLLFSIIYYIYGSYKYIGILLLSILLNYIIGILINKLKYKKIILTFGIIINIAILVYFKIDGFYGSSDNLLPLIGPLGISFYTFQELSYIIDVYRGITKPQKNIFKYSLYVMLFPQLIAGPIVRYEDVAEKLENRKTSFNDFLDGVSLFILGLFKKSVIADSISNCAFEMFLNKSFSICNSWLGAIFLMFQLYYDFSAYSDMAIGILKMFGFNNIKANFNNPYRSRSINEFWKRWNISLGNWFNDYILFPLSNSKIYHKMIKILSVLFNKKMALKVGNFIVLLIIWILVGMWHGIGINYLIFGLYYFIFLYLEKILRLKKVPRIISHVYTLLVIMIGTVIFFSYRDSNFIFLKSMFFNVKFVDGRFFLILTNYKYELLLATIFILPIQELLRKIINNKKIYYIVKNTIYICMFLISLYFIIVNQEVPFMYFNF